MLNQKIIDAVGYTTPAAPAGTAMSDINFTAVGVGVLEGWRTSPATNNGFNLWMVDDGNPGRTLKAATKEYPTSAWHPVLTLTTVPEPSALVLLVLGSLTGIGSLRRLS